jgi:hypothetical protein
MSIFQVAFFAICAAIGAAVGLMCGRAHVMIGGGIGFIIGFVLIFTPYPYRAAAWYLERKEKDKKTRHED